LVVGDGTAGDILVGRQEVGDLAGGDSTGDAGARKTLLSDVLVRKAVAALAKDAVGHAVAGKAAVGKAVVGNAVGEGSVTGEAAAAGRMGGDSWRRMAAAGDSATSRAVTSPVVVGFLEFTRSKFGASEIYVNSDFAVPGTHYERLSKLIVMLLLSKDVRQWLERKLMQRVPGVFTTAFTDRPVSMKYRGVLELVKRGVKSDGRKYLNYEGTFSDKTAQEVYEEWLNKYGSKRRSKS
jgi:hypothetical protein